jgi:predicted acyl esterase
LRHDPSILDDLRPRVNRRLIPPSGTILRVKIAAYTNRSPAILLFVIVSGSALPFLSQTPQQPPANPSFKLSKNIAVPMRDGVVLRADVLLPSNSNRFPTLVYRTPYNKESVLRGYKSFEKAVARGYAVVLQDVRGRYASDGEFTPYQTEGRDGYDTIEWAAQQPWSDGNVGTFGLSYPGAVQWLAAVENPPHLKAMVPAMTFSTPRNFF